ncbi:uncharacterized protein LOC144280573 [Canis aureus]
MCQQTQTLFPHCKEKVKSLYCWMIARLGNRFGTGSIPSSTLPSLSQNYKHKMITAHFLHVPSMWLQCQPHKRRQIWAALLEDEMLCEEKPQPFQTFEPTHLTPQTYENEPEPPKKLGKKTEHDGGQWPVI